MSVCIKRRFCFRRGVVRFSFEADHPKLSEDVVAVCEALSIGAFIIEVFNRDPINELLIRNSLFILKQKNLNYYLHPNIDFLKQIKIGELRHMCIYSIPRLSDIQPLLLHSINQSPFVASFGNYLDTCELIVDGKYYPSELIKSLLD